MQFDHPRSLRVQRLSFAFIVETDPPFQAVNVLRVHPQEFALVDQLSKEFVCVGRMSGLAGFGELRDEGVEDGSSFA
jgi:hypothetical protein